MLLRVCSEAVGQEADGTCSSRGLCCEYTVDLVRVGARTGIPNTRRLDTQSLW